MSIATKAVDLFEKGLDSGIADYKVVLYDAHSLFGPNCGACTKVAIYETLPDCSCPPLGFEEYYRFCSGQKNYTLAVSGVIH